MSERERGRKGEMESIKASVVCCMLDFGQCSSAENIVLIPRIAVAPLVRFLFVITNKKLQQVTNDLSVSTSHRTKFVTFGDPGRIEVQV
jgi:hypothetical protein